MRGRHLVLALRENPDASHVDVAAYVGIPVGGVGPTWTRCARRLRTVLG